MNLAILIVLLLISNQTQHFALMIFLVFFRVFTLEMALGTFFVIMFADNNWSNKILMFVTTVEGFTCIKTKWLNCIMLWKLSSFHVLQSRNIVIVASTRLAWGTNRLNREVPQQEYKNKLINGNMYYKCFSLNMFNLLHCILFFVCPCLIQYIHGKLREKVHCTYAYFSAVPLNILELNLPLKQYRINCIIKIEYFCF